MKGKVLELSGSVFSLSNEEVGFFTFLTHILFAFKECFHDLFELLLHSISFSLKQLVALLSSSNFLLVELHIPASRYRVHPTGGDLTHGYGIIIINYMRDIKT